MLEILSLPDADIRLYPQWFSPEVSDRLFYQLSDTIAWTQETATIFGKPVPLPRLTAWYGDPGAVYRYTGMTLQPRPWTAVLLEIKARVETVAPVRFNSVLLNLYRHGQDSVGWHSDDEPTLGKNPAIASVSLGVVRRFQLKHKRHPTCRCDLELPPGSLLLMQGTTQHHWLHQIPKSRQITQPRINLTFRRILSDPGSG